VKILVVHNRYRSSAPSGENRVVDQESSALAAAGHVVEHFERRSDAIEHWTAPRKALLPATVVWSEEARRAVARALRRLRPDVVHLHNTFPLISPSVLSACRAEGVPVVVTVHNYRLLCVSGDLFRDGAPCHACPGRRVPGPAVVHGCYRGSSLATLPVTLGTVAHRRAWRTKVSAYVFVSEAQRRAHAGLGLPPERVFVKWNLVPSLPAPAHATRQHLVAFLGRLDPAKGVPLLMEAWDRFRAEAPGSRLRLVIAGAGPLAGAVTTWAADRSSVRAVGLLDPGQCASLLAEARAVVVPSRWEETFGLVAVEAMAAGVPAVAAGHGSFPELIRDGVDGVLFDPREAAGLVGALHDVDAHPDRWETYGRHARRSYEERFDPERNLDDLLRIYRFALDHPVGSDGRRAATAGDVVTHPS